MLPRWVHVGMLGLALGGSLLEAFADDRGWPQHRGPGGDGVALTDGLPLHWSEQRNLAWKAALPGRGRSSPVVLGKGVWVTTALERGVQRTRIGSDDMQTAEHVELMALALNRTNGSVLWQVTLDRVDHPDPVHWYNSWATPTPVVEPGRVYCDFGTFGTVCLDAETGERLWQRRLAVDHQVGPGSSPVLHGDLLVLVRDGRDAQYVTALDKRTGEMVWRTDRPPLTASSGNLKKSFSTPLRVDVRGRMQLVIPGAQWAVGYDPTSGKELWRVRHGDGFSIGTSPVSGHGLVFVGTGCFKAQLLAIRPDGEGEVTDTHVAWRTLRQVPVMSSPVLAGENLFWVSDDGMLTAVEARTGEVRWQERLGGNYLASPVVAEGRLYVCSMEGKTTVVKAGPQFEKLAENLLEGTLIASPAMVEDAIFLRTDTHLYCVREPR